ncbi:MAG: translocation/assembly module TamB domain-containing protein [Gammaproteobacteria bacterium]|nr:translocation/assembly module TamB domain-containing protein [Gammaproteobacteria bacterium]
MKRLPPLGLLFLLITGLALTWVLHSSVALRWGAEFASRRLALTLETESLEGGLAGPIRIRGLRLVTGNISIQAETLDMDWWAGDLLRGRVNLKYLSAGELVVTRLPEHDATRLVTDSTSDMVLPSLPVSLDLKQIQLDGLSYIGEGQSQRLLEHFRGSASWDSDGLQVGVASLERNDLALSTSTLRIGGEAPYTLGGEFAWRIPGALLGEQTEDLVGRSQLQGVLARPESRSTLLQPATVSLELNAYLDQTVVTLAGRIDTEELSLDSLREGWPDQALTLHSDFSIDGRVINANGTLQWADLPTLEIAIQTLLEEHQLQLLDLDIRREGVPGHLRAAGRLALSTDQHSELDVSWKDVDLEMGADQIRLRSDGKARITGTPDSYALEIDSDSRFGEYPPINLAASAVGDNKGMVISRLHAQLMNGSADGEARLDWEQGLQASARIQASGLDTSTLREEARGILDLETAVAMQVDASGSHLTVDLKKLGGHIGGERLSGKGALVMDPGRIQLNSLELELGGGTISASGVLAEELDFKAKIQGLRASGWVPGLEGTFAAELVLAGPLETPGVRGSLSALQPAFEQWRAEQLDVQLDVDISNQQPSKVEIHASGLRSGEQILGTLEIEGEGAAGGHLLNVQLSGGDLELDGQVQGAYQADSGWLGQIKRFKLVSASYSPSPWILASGGELAIGATETRAGELCLNQEQALACFSGGLADGAGTLRLRVSQLPLSLLNILFHDTLELSGQLDGSAQGQFNQQGHLTGEAKLELGESTVHWLRSDGDVSTLAFARARLTGTADEQGLAMQATLDLDQRDVLELGLKLQRGPGPATSWPAQGRLALSIADLSAYDALVPELGSLSGNLSTRLELTGSLDEPLTSGNLNLQDMETYLPELGTRVSGVSLDLQANSQTTLVKARALVGDGTAELDGSVKLLHGEPEASFHLTGGNLTLLDNSKIYLQASPDLTLALSGDLLRISGKLQVPVARIQPVNLANAVRSSPDAIVLDDTGNQRENRGRVKVRLNVLVELGDKVKFDGYGLNAYFAGSLRVRDMTGKLTTARGELNVLDGKYKLYGMELGVERGQLLFAGGPIDTPGLNIRASRHTDDVRVGVDIGGTLLEPTLSMFSSPTMPQSEIIAYLLTGKPMADMDAASGQKASALGDAFALAGGNLLTGEIGSRVGLDELSLQSEGETGDEELVLGKYLSPNLYVSYGIGLYEAINTVRVRYQLNKNLSVRSESGVAQSIDLFWSAER